MKNNETDPFAKSMAKGKLIVCTSEIVIIRFSRSWSSSKRWKSSDEFPKHNLNAQQTQIAKPQGATLANDVISVSKMWRSKNIMLMKIPVKIQ